MSLGNGAEQRTLRTMCPMNCHPTHCGLRVRLEGQSVLETLGDPEHPESRGFACVRGRAVADVVDNPERVLVPRVRSGLDGFVDTTWEDALEQIARAIEQVGAARSAVYTGHGVRGQFAARFASMLGTQWWDPSIVCWGLGGLGFRLTGVTEVNTAEDMAAHAELIVLWGASIASQPTTAPRIVTAKARGARVLLIDVREGESAGLADETYLVRPGSDAALALALLHVIVREKLYSESFVREHTVGFDELCAHVAAFSLAWAARETGLSVERIEGLARTYAACEHAVILAGGSSMHKTGNGWQAARAIACLPALTGSLGKPGAGMGPRHAAQSHGMGLSRIVPPDSKPAESVVASDMNEILEALEDGRVQVLLLLGTNFLSSFADGGRVGQALARLKLVVCFDLFETDTSREHAHLLLPGTSWLEELGYKITNTHVYLTEQLLEPRGQAKPSFWLLEQLARRLGAIDFFPWTSVEGAIDAIFDHPAFGHASVASIRASGGARRLEVSSVGHANLKFSTPSGKIELLSERAHELGLPRLPVPPPEGENSPSSQIAARFPLVLVQGRSLTHFHSFYDHGRVLPLLHATEPEPVLWLNPSDALARGIASGDDVDVFNERGRMAAKARVTEKVQAGVVWMHSGWRGVNQLTSSVRQVPLAVARAFSSAGAASYQARVDVTLSS